MPVQSQEARIILAIEAIRTSKKLSRRKAAKIYKVPYATLSDRMNGAISLPERRPANTNLNKLEEQIIVNHILDRDSRGFSPRQADVEDMANWLRKTRRAKPVGKLWAHRFVQRRPELKTRFNRVYDFQRALCENPELIGAWFRLVGNMRAKYGVVDGDFYNFDETGTTQPDRRPFADKSCSKSHCLPSRKLANVAFFNSRCVSKGYGDFST